MPSWHQTVWGNLSYYNVPVVIQGQTALLFFVLRPSEGPIIEKELALYNCKVLYVCITSPVYVMSDI